MGALTGWVLAPRRPGRVGRVVINLGLQAGQAGLFLLLSYAVITYPGRRQWQLADQPTPAAMWQAALGLAALGTVTLLLVLLLTPRVDHDAPAAARYPLAWTIPVGMVVVDLVIAAVATVVAVEDKVRWWPLLFWAMSSAAGFYYWRKHR